MYTTQDGQAADPTPSSDDRMSLYCQIRFEKTRRHTGNKEGILATITTNWQQEGYADNKEGHIGNNIGTMAIWRAYWQQEGHADNKEGHIGNNIGTLAIWRAYWQQE